MDKTESLKLYVLGTMLVTLGLKRCSLSEPGLWRPGGSLVRVPGRVCSGLVKRKAGLPHLKWQLRQGRLSCH